MHHHPASPWWIGFFSQTLFGCVLSFAMPTAAAEISENDAVVMLSNSNIAQIQENLFHGRVPSQLMTGITTLLNDQAGGANDKIDAGLETLYLAIYLFNTANSLIDKKRVLSQHSIENYQSKVLPNTQSIRKLATQLKFDEEGAQLAQKSHGEVLAKYWDPHFQKTNSIFCTQFQFCNKIGN